MNVSVPFSLYTSFDYLGFWLYSVFALLVAAPLYSEALSLKICAISLGVFGVIYQLMLLALWRGDIAAVDIEGYTYREISEETGIPEGTLLSRRHRAVSLLLKELEQKKEIIN